MSTRQFSSVLILVSFLLVSGCSEDVVTEIEVGYSKPHVILIVVDTLRADHLSHYGYPLDTAAGLDAFRDRSTLFRRAYSTAPWTAPSTASLLTGLSTAQHGMSEFGDVLDAEIDTLAEILAARGYETRAISFNPNIVPETGFDQGFEIFDSFDGEPTEYRDIVLMRRQVEGWITEKRDSPLFLYLQPMNVHGPYKVRTSRQSGLLGRPPSRDFEYYGSIMSGILRDGELALRSDHTPEMQRSLVEQYDSAIYYSSEELGKLFTALDRAGLFADSLVILTSDHGEELFEHGGFSHGYSLYQEVLHIPLYVHLPGQDEARSDDRLVSLLDILPTILDVINLEPRASLLGRSLLDESDDRDDCALVQQTGWRKRAIGSSILIGHEHLIELESGYDRSGAQTELYDLALDPFEERNRSQEAPGRVATLSAKLRDCIRRDTEQRSAVEKRNALDKMDIDRLRALGYVE